MSDFEDDFEESSVCFPFTSERFPELISLNLLSELALLHFPRILIHRKFHSWFLDLCQILKILESEGPDFCLLQKIQLGLVPLFSLPLNRQYSHISGGFKFDTFVSLS